MYRIMIVDDDLILRKSLVEQVDWESHGIEVAAEAKDGKEALCKIEDIMPQIIVTDIQMPIMGGLQFTEIVSRLYPKIKIILLTAYEEFEYAKKALEYGVCQYVLKYESRETVLEAVQKAINQLDMETENERQREQSLKLERKKFYREICCNKMTHDEVYAKAKELNINLFEKCYAVLSFKIESLETMDEIQFIVQTKVWFQAIEDAIKNRCNDAGYDIFFFQGKEYLNAVLISGPISYENEFIDMLKTEIEKLQRNQSIYLYAGMGRWYESIEHVYDSYMEAIKVNQLRDILDKVYKKEEHPVLIYRPEMSAEETTEELVGKVKNYINENYSGIDLSLEQIAHQVHLSANYVSTLFKKNAGLNISDYIIRVRMQLHYLLRQILRLTRSQNRLAIQMLSTLASCLKGIMASRR